MDDRLLLFDIDQTLLDAAGAGRRAMQKIASELYGESFSFERVLFHGNLDPLIFIEAAEHHGLDDAVTHELKFRHQYLPELEAELRRGGDTVRALPGVFDVLTALRARVDNGGGVVLGLLTGNYAAAAPLKLSAVGIDRDWFPVGAFGDEAPTRPDLVPLAMQRFKSHSGRAADPTRVVVIGDTPKDVHCAKAHGCVAFGVATGHYTVDQLVESGADIAVDDLSDAAPLLDLIQ